MRLISRIVAIALAAWIPPSDIALESRAYAQSGDFDEAGFQAYLSELGAKARAAGVSQAAIDRILPTLQFNPRTIQLDRAQPGGAAGNSATPSFASYRAGHVTSFLADRGREHYADNIVRLNEIGRRYGVPPAILIAIWGHETSYGAVTGNFDLMDALASLAYEGRRRELFSNEFVAAMKLVDRGYSRSQLKGSWAGAMGYPQFMPSVFLRLGVDGDGDGRADIWSNKLDALASIAHYLADAGWKPNVPWGIAVSVPDSLSREGMTTRLVSPRCPRVFERHSQWRTIREWRAMGLVAQNGYWLDDEELASLLEPDGPGKGAWLLTTNYRAILDYNCSNFYALTVGLLADAIMR
jgi:lytic murein transglycosylase